MDRDARCADDGGGAVADLAVLVLENVAGGRRRRGGIGLVNVHVLLVLRQYSKGPECELEPLGPSQSNFDM